MSLLQHTPFFLIKFFHSEEHLLRYDFWSYLLFPKIFILMQHVDLQTLRTFSHLGCHQSTTRQRRSIRKRVASTTQTAPSTLVNFGGALRTLFAQFAGKFHPMLTCFDALRHLPDFFVEFHWFHTIY